MPVSANRPGSRNIYSILRVAGFPKRKKEERINVEDREKGSKKGLENHFDPQRFRRRVE